MEKSYPPFQPEIQEHKQNPHFYFLSGLSGTTDSGDIMVPEIQAALDSLVPTATPPESSLSATTPNSLKKEAADITYLSSVASGEKVDTNPESSENRYTKYSKEILERLKNNQEVVILAHSFGAQELDRLFEDLTGNPDLEDNVDKLTIILMAPYGLIEKFKHAPRLLRFLEIARAQMPIGPLNSFRQGLESLAYLPPAEIDEDVLDSTVSALWADNTEYKNLRANDAIQTFQTIHKDEGYFVTLPTEQQEAIKASVAPIDVQLSAAITAKNWPICKQLLKRRGKALNKQMEEAYKSSMSADMYNTMAQAGLGVAGLYERVLKGGAFTRLQELSKENAQGKKPKIKAIMPEYDVIYTLKELQKQFNWTEEEALANVALLSSTTHNSMALNSRGLGEAIAHLLS
ncbi:MAG: hypothetical protein GW925_02700 [Candidatus Pacebacteria bacterium]|nr:hypothetical protein [Candidatus Paceibacterota bacterium]